MNRRTHAQVAADTARAIAAWQSITDPVQRQVFLQWTHYRRAVQDLAMAGVVTGDMLNAADDQQKSGTLSPQDYDWSAVDAALA